MLSHVGKTPHFTGYITPGDDIFKVRLLAKQHLFFLVLITTDRPDSSVGTVGVLQRLQ